MAKAKRKPRPWWVTAAKWSALGLIGYETYVTLTVRRQRRRDVFNAAVNRANATQKQLIVIGDPDAAPTNRFLGRDYTCGSICIDTKGCLACDESKSGSLLEQLKELPDGSGVVFVSEQLEKVDDIAAVVQQLNRVSGGDLFVASVQPWTLTAFMWPGHKRRILEAPPEFKHVDYKPLPFKPDLRTRTRERNRIQLGRGGVLR